METPDNPSNAVLAEKINALKEIVVANRTDTSNDLSAILTQTTKTNGRVDKLEKWRNIATGVILILTTVVIPLFIALAVNFLTSTTPK